MRKKVKEINSLRSQGVTLHTDRKFSKHQEIKKDTALSYDASTSLSQNSKKLSHNKPVHANEISTVIDSFNTSIGQFVILQSGRISLYIKHIPRDITIAMVSLSSVNSVISTFRGYDITPQHISGELKIHPDRVLSRYNRAIARCQEGYLTYLATIGKPTD